MAEGEAAEGRKAQRSGGGAKCCSSGQLSINKPLFGLLNRSQSYKLNFNAPFKIVAVRIERDFFIYPVFAPFWRNFVSSE